MFRNKSIYYEQLKTYEKQEEVLSKCAPRFNQHFPNTVFKTDNAVGLRCGLKQCHTDRMYLFLYFRIDYGTVMTDATRPSFVYALFGFVESVSASIPE